MPTAYRRTNVTHVPAVQAIIDAGRQYWPDASDKDVLIRLAERGLSTAAPRGVAGLMLAPGTGRPVTVAEIDDLLLDD